MLLLLGGGVGALFLRGEPIGPGLVGGVMVGLAFGKAVALARGLPLVAVNHLEGHAVSARLAADIPYPFLLPVQVIILALQGWVCADFARGEGYWVRPRPGLGRWLQRASYVYAGAMLVRYVVTMGVHPERRWLGTGTIPIVFHWVLAAYLFTLGRFHARA